MVCSEAFKESFASSNVGARLFFEGLFEAPIVQLKVSAL